MTARKRTTSRGRRLYRVTVYDGANPDTGAHGFAGSTYDTARTQVDALDHAAEVNRRVGDAVLVSRGYRGGEILTPVRFYPPRCIECTGGRGWDVFNGPAENNGKPTDIGGQVQRCDTCERYPDDASAVPDACAAGYRVRFISGVGWEVYRLPWADMDTPGVLGTRPVRDARPGAKVGRGVRA